MESYPGKKYLEVDTTTTKPKNKKLRITVKQINTWLDQHYAHSRSVKSKYLNGWHGQGFFIPGGFILYIPGIVEGGLFDEELLEPKETVFGLSSETK